MEAGELETGVYRQPEFLDVEAVARVRRAMAAGELEPAAVLGEGVSFEDRVRRAISVEVDEATLAWVEGVLDRHRDILARHFRTTLTSREGPSFLRYEPGGHYRPHRDRAEVPSWPDAAKRLVAVVLFLNSSREVDPTGEFEGGILRLFPYGDVPHVDVHPRAGLLVAFRADRLHEVTSVRAGTREAIVDWYYA